MMQCDKWKQLLPRRVCTHSAAVQHSANNGQFSIFSRCAALQRALCGRAVSCRAVNENPSELNSRDRVLVVRVQLRRVVLCSLSLAVQVLEMRNGPEIIKGINAQFDTNPKHCAQKPSTETRN